MRFPGTLTRETLRFDFSLPLCSGRETFANEAIDVHAPRFKIRHVDKRFHFPLYLSEPVDSLEIIILMGLQRIAGEIPKSSADADSWMLFT